MNRLIIIGNGFDLAHKIPTSYQDFLLNFFKSRIKKAIQNVSKIEEAFLSVERMSGTSYQLSNSWEDCSNIEQLLNDRNIFWHHRPLSEALAGHDVTFRPIRITVKSWFFLQMLVDGSWTNIEHAYYKLLLQIMKKVHYQLPSVSVLNQDFNSLKYHLARYLEEVEKVSLGGQFKTIHQYQSLFMEKIAMRKDDREPDIIMRNIFINFNYTSVLSKYITELPRPNNEEIQVHGSILDPDSIIFGFGDELDRHYSEIEELNDNAYFEHIKSFGYLKDTVYQRLMDIVNSSVPFEVYVLGHSLGLSDRTMLGEIFQSEYLTRVKIFYHQREDDTNDFTEKTHEISRHFKDKGRMRLKIVPFTESEPMPQMSNIKS